jgi:hypothetical protein
MPAQLERDGKTGYPFDQLMVQQRHAHFQRVRHARPVHFGEDIANEISFHVQVLHA